MHSSPITVRNDGPALFAALTGLLVLLLAAPARAEVALYEAVVPLQGTTEADRQAGLSAALRAAAVRATGQPDAGSHAAVAQAAADPGRYVQQYGTTVDRMLKVGFDARAMEQLLLKAGLPLWPAERPDTLVVVEVPAGAGGGSVLLDGDARPQRREIERAGVYRGLPLVWPRSGVDPASARSRALSGGGAVDAAGGEAPVVLVGTVSGQAWDWVFVHAGRTVQRHGSLADGVNLAADTLAARYAPASSRTLQVLTIEVGGMTGVRPYAALLEYLRSLSFVRRVSVEELAGETVRLQVTLRGDLEQLRRIAALDGRLQPASGVDFVFQP